MDIGNFYCASQKLIVSYYMFARQLFNKALLSGDLVEAFVFAKDFNGLRHLRETTPQQFKRGILFYTGEQVISFGDQMVAVPIAMLWNG